MSVALGKTLVLRLSSLGDLILMVPLLRALFAARAGQEMHLVCKEKYAGLFEGNDFLDRIFLVKRGGPAELASLRSALARERYDTVIDAHNVIRSNLLFHTTRARNKIQIRKDQMKKWLLIRGRTNRYGRLVSQSERYAELARRLGVAIPADSGELPIPAAAARSADVALAPAARDGKPLVALAPGARWPTKRWPAEHFERLGSAAGNAGCAVVLMGGPEDAPQNAAIARNVFPAPLDLAGRLSIIESAAVLKRCDALVTNDSAPLHLAEAVGTPVVALFGPTVREFGYYPRLPRSIALEVDLPCRPCSRNGARLCHLGTKECLTAIAPERAMQALLSVLGRERNSR